MIIRTRLAFYVLYMVMGAAIVVRLLLMGPRWQTVSGVLLGIAFIALGAYRISLYRRLRSTSKQ